jgi:shikimate dehydrogenase
VITDLTTDQTADPTQPAESPSIRRAAVLGSPVAHSLSPTMHRAAYAALGLTGWRYDAIEVAEDQVAGFLARLGDEWAGVSLTMPLKRAVRVALVGQSALAREVGSVNTAVRRTDGWHGFNTDVHGIVRALAEAGAEQVSEALLLGGGATAASALAALRELGCPSIRVAVRSAARAAPLLAAADRLAVPVELVAFEPEQLGAAIAALPPSAVVISTVPAQVGASMAAGLTAGLGRTASGRTVPPRTVPPRTAPGRTAPGRTARGAPVLLDVVYHPWPTPLAAAWTATGSRCVGGLAMLAHQAEGQVRLMTGLRIDVEVLRRAGQDELDRRAPR